MANNEPYHEAAAAALGRLAGEITALGCDAHLSAPAGRRPSLTVRHPAAPMLTKYVVADAEWFWWSWADRIARVTEISAAARSVVRALTAGGEFRAEEPRGASDPHFRVSTVLDRGRFQRLQSLEDAVAFRRGRLAAPCPDCAATAPGRKCDDHARDLDLIAEYLQAIQRSELALGPAA